MESRSHEASSIFMLKLWDFETGNFDTLIFYFHLRESSHASTFRLTPLHQLWVRMLIGIRQNSVSPLGLFRILLLERLSVLLSPIRHLLLSCLQSPKRGVIYSRHLSNSGSVTPPKKPSLFEPVSRAQKIVKTAPKASNKHKNRSETTKQQLSRKVIFWNTVCTKPGFI